MYAWTMWSRMNKINFFEFTAPSRNELNERKGIKKTTSKVHGVIMIASKASKLHIDTQEDTYIFQSFGDNTVIRRHNNKNNK